MVYSQGSVTLKGKEAFPGSKFSMLDANSTMLKHNLKGNRRDEVFFKVT